MRRNLRKKAILFQWFLGEPKTGGDKVFREIYNALLEESSTDAILIQPPRIMSSKTRYLYKFSYLMLFRVISNILSQIFSRKGYIVYNGSLSGNFEYIQPPALNNNNKTNRSLEILTNKIPNIIDRITIFNKSSIVLAVYNSKYTMEKYSIKNARYNIVIYPGILSEIPDIQPECKETILVTLSRINKDKSLENLKNLLPSGNFEHYVIGYMDDAAYADYLKNTLNKTKFAFNATDDEKRRFLVRAKIMIHPSTFEPAGISLMEAMAYGVIPIAHNSGGVPEIVPNEYLYNTPEEAKKLIIKYLAEYNEKHFNNLRSIASSFLNSKFHENIRNAIVEHFINSQNQKRISKNPPF